MDKLLEKLKSYGPTISQAIHHIAKKTPIIQTITSYPGTAHIKAIKKWSVLWILSILPLLFSGLRAEINRGEPILPQYISAVTSVFGETQLLAYVASLLSPVLYLIYERLQEWKSYAFSLKAAPAGTQLPDGFGWITAIALLLFLLSAFVYGLPNNKSDTVWDSIRAAGVIGWSYSYALFCWYLTILMEDATRGTGEFLSQVKNEEANLQNKFTHRLKEGRANE